MDFTNQEIQQILFGHFLNETHLNERRKVYLKRIAKNFRDLWPDQIVKIKTPVKPVILLFSNELFFDVKSLHSLNIFSFKDTLSIGDRLNFRHEELLLVIATFFPRLRKRFFRYVYERISRTLTSLKLVAFVCNYPQLIDHIIAKYCRLNKIPVITIQHGVYMPKFYTPLPFEKDRADFIFVWGQLYTECYKRGGIHESRLKTCAPPIKPYAGSTHRTSRPERPVFLGQALYKIHPDVFTKYNHVVNDLINFWSQQGIKMDYKPHPREVLAKSLTGQNQDRMKILDPDYVSDDFFNTHDVAYSINSTSLIHALCAGLLCFQFDLGIEDLPTEDFSQWSSIVNLKGVGSKHRQDLSNPAAFRLDRYFLNLHNDFQGYNSRLLLTLLGHG